MSLAHNTATKNNHSNNHEFKFLTLGNVPKIALILTFILCTLILQSHGQMDLNLDNPQWKKPRLKRTVGADEPYPPWNPPLCPPHTQGLFHYPNSISFDH